MKITDLTPEQRYTFTDIQEGWFEGCTHYWSGGRMGWVYHVCKNPFCQASNLIHARQIEAGDGYRLVGWDEVILPTDECSINGIGWNTIHRWSGLKPSTYPLCQPFLFRRRIQPEIKGEKSDTFYSIKLEGEKLPRARCATYEIAEKSAKEFFNAYAKPVTIYELTEKPIAKVTTEPAKTTVTKL
jgi:hypothetical protein